MPYAPGGSPVWTTYTYNGRGRTLTIRKPDNSLTTYLYTGNTTKVTDAAGNWKIFTMDAGNLVQVTEPDPQLGTVYTNYTYNLLDKLTQVQMLRAQHGTTIRTFTYDQNGQGGRLLTATNPENGTVIYSYNGDGTLASRRDAKNQLVQYSYDSYKRLTQVTRPDGQDVYTYDQAAGAVNAWGRVAQVTFQGRPVHGAFTGQPDRASTFTYTYQYTAAGLVTSKSMALKLGPYPDGYQGFYINAPALTATYGYNTEGKITSIGYPLSGPVFSYGYDTMGRQNAVTRH